MESLFFVDTRKTGTGKTTHAINDLPHELEKRFNKKFKMVFLLVPYSRQQSQLLFSEKTRERVSSLRKAQEGTATKPIVSTYSAFNIALNEGSIDIKDCLIIIDELPTFLQFATYQAQQADLLEYLIDAELFQQSTFYGLTGTPEILFDYYNKLDLPFKFVDDTPRKQLTLHCNKGLFIKNGSAITYAKHLIQEGFSGAKAFYVDYASDAVKLKKMFDSKGYKSAIIISESNESIDEESLLYYTDIMNSQIYNGLTVNEWIDIKSDVPPQLDVLIFNASARDGISIYDNRNRFDEIIIQSACAMTIRQSRARIRHDLEQLTIVYNEQQKNSYYDEIKDFIKFSKSDENLIERYFAQEQSAKMVYAWQELKNEAIKHGQSFNLKRPETLSYAVHKSKHGYFRNVYLEGFLRYQMDNYTHSSVTVDTDGNTTKRELIKADGFKYPTIEQFASDLMSELCTSGFEIVNGSRIKAETRNAENLTYESIQNLLDLKPGESRNFTNKELKEIVKQAQLITTERHPASVPTLVKELEKHCSVEKKRTKNARFYQITMLNK